MKHRYEGFAEWTLRRGNLHVHSTRSDGGRTPEELVQLYRDANYDFLAFTDHQVFSNASSLSSRTFLCLDGIEIHGQAADGTGAHAIAISPDKAIEPSPDFNTALDRSVSAGAFIALAHPHWCGNSFDLLDDPRFDAVEIYNEVCEDICAKGSSVSYWDWALGRGRTVLGVAVDDAHLGGPYQRYARAWVMVKAQRLERAEIVSSLRSGQFYASTGPQFLDIRCEGGTLHVRTSPVRSICAVGRNGKGRQDRSQPTDQLISEARVDISDWNIADPQDYLRLEIEDEHGRRAWTNPL